MRPLPTPACLLSPSLRFTLLLPFLPSLRFTLLPPVLPYESSALSHGTKKLAPATLVSPPIPSFLSAPPSLSRPAFSADGPLSCRPPRRNHDGRPQRAVNDIMTVSAAGALRDGRWWFDGCYCRAGLTSVLTSTMTSFSSPKNN
jgi:hypothetical protein